MLGISSPLHAAGRAAGTGVAAPNRRRHPAASASLAASTAPGARAPLTSSRARRPSAAARAAAPEAAVAAEDAAAADADSPSEGGGIVPLVGAAAGGAAPAALGDLSSVDIEGEVSRRRNFAIISHPDAGKTTMTEKLVRAPRFFPVTPPSLPPLLQQALCYEAGGCTSIRPTSPLHAPLPVDTPPPSAPLSTPAAVRRRHPRALIHPPYFNTSLRALWHASPPPPLFYASCCTEAPSTRRGS